MKHQAGKMTEEAFSIFSNVSIVIPVYNSEETIGKLVDEIVVTLRDSFKSLEIVLVNDGSVDNSHLCVLEAMRRHPETVKYIKLARNFGEHNAVMCGLNYVTGECVAIIDDDFQNPPSEILALVEKLREGYDVVYSYYAKKHHSRFRNFGSALTDWFTAKLLNKPKELYLSSFKVMTANLVQSIIQYKGPYPYIDGIVLRSTEKIGQQLCRHEKRESGRSNYTIGRLLHLWMNMFTGYSIMPLRLASFVGISMSVLSIFLIIFFAISRVAGGIFAKHEIPVGWASTIIVVIFFGGLQLCVLGLIGEYLGKLSLTINQLPQFVVSETHGVQNDGEKDGAKPS